MKPRDPEGAHEAEVDSVRVLTWRPSCWSQGPGCPCTQALSYPGAHPVQSSLWIWIQPPEGRGPQVQLVPTWTGPLALRVPGPVPYSNPLGNVVLLPQRKGGSDTRTLHPSWSPDFQRLTALLLRTRMCPQVGLGSGHSQPVLLPGPLCPPSSVPGHG